MHKKREAPALYYGSVPESQDHAHQLVGHALDNLNHYLASFESALKLHDHANALRKSAKGAQKKQLLRHWQFMAARDGALSVFHFNWALQGLSDSLSKCQYLSSRLNLKELSAARKIFEKLFPNVTAVRNAVSHSSEKAKNPREHLEHGFTGMCKIPGLNLGKVRNFVITDHLYRRNYCNTWKGKIECYKISPKTLSDLASVRDIVFNAFDDMNRRVKDW